MEIAPIKQRHFVWAAIGIFLIAGFSWLWWQCARNPQINFLEGHGKAQWIIYPKPPEAGLFLIEQTSTEFRREFQLARVPEKAALSVRAFRSFAVRVNGMEVKTNASAGSNWKDATTIDISRLLHEGTNELLITVFNKKAPPALWASLDCGSNSFVSGPEWDASILGAARRSAWPATVPTKVERGNDVFGGENTFDSLRLAAPTLLLFTVLSCAIVFGALKLLGPSGKNGEARPAISKSQLMVQLVIGLGILWVILFINNLSLLPRDFGFDEHSHEEYIDYICVHGSLPLATDGFEMCHPPLYYIIGSGIAFFMGDDVLSAKSAAVLKCFGMLTGIASIVLVFLSLRLLFPKQPGAQWFGVLLAAFIPEQLYLSHYVTNEFLAAALVTASLYACLRLMKSENDSRMTALAVGFFIGAALLTKFTPIMAVPFIGGVLLWRILDKSGRERFSRIVTLLMVFGTAFAVGAWHYLRVYKHFGTPVVHDWDPQSGYSWWADKGFQTFRYLASFGESLVHPYYAGYHSFADGIYSTMWGDGLYSGLGKIEFRPAWNYPLMTAGYLLALLPMAIILTGVVVCLIRFLRRPEPVWFLLLGTTFTTYAALFYMSVKLPYFCNVKAFYAMMTLLPLCAFGGAGWCVLAKLAGRLRPALYVAALVWAMNSYCSFWIRGDDVSTQMMRANHLGRTGHQPEAIAAFTSILQANPHMLMARKSLAVELDKLGDSDGAFREISLILADDPEHPIGLVQSGMMLATRGQRERALEQLRRAVKAAPDLAVAYEKMSVISGQLGQIKEAAGAAREGLRITPFNPQMHLALAVALEGLGRSEESRQHLRIMTGLTPDVPMEEVYDQFGVALGQQKSWESSIRQFAAACELKPAQPKYLIHIAQAQAAAGRFDDAITSATKASELANTQGDTTMATVSSQLIEAFKAYRDGVKK